MKKTIIALSILCLAIFDVPAHAGFGNISVSTSTNFVLFTGITNAAATDSAGNPLTNTWTFYPPSSYVVVTNVVNTNEVLVGSVYLQVPANLMTNFPGYSNLLFIGSFSQSFSNGLPAGGVWSTNTVPTPGSLPFPVILNANNGIYTNGIFAK